MPVAQTPTTKDSTSIRILQGGQKGFVPYNVQTPSSISGAKSLEELKSAVNDIINKGQDPSGYNGDLTIGEVPHHAQISLNLRTGECCICLVLAQLSPW